MYLDPNLVSCRLLDIVQSLPGVNDNHIILLLLFHILVSTDPTFLLHVFHNNPILLLGSAIQMTADHRDPLIFRHPPRPVESANRHIHVVLPVRRKIIREMRVVKHGIMLSAVGKENLPVFGRLLPNVKQVLG